jgi:hypothetical protein
VYGGKLKVWQVITLGAVWIALGIGLHVFGRWDPPLARANYARIGLTQILWALKFWITFPVAIGLFHWYGAYTALKRRDHVAAQEPAQEPAKPARAAPKLPPPPNVETDPFRAPPQPRPLAIVRHGSQPAPAPVADGDPDDQPKLLR